MAAAASRRAITPVFVLVCLSISIQLSSSKDPFKIQRQFHHYSELFFDETSFDDRRVAYAVCKDQSRGQLTRRCEVFLETLWPRTTRSCNVILTPNLAIYQVIKLEKGNYKHGNIRVVPLRDGKVILVWFGQTPIKLQMRLHLYNVDFENCTLNENFEVPVGHYDRKLNIIPYTDDTYDVLYFHKLVRENRFMRITNDAMERGIRTGLNDVPTEADQLGFGYALPPDSEIKGYLYSEKDKIFLHINGNNKELEVSLNFTRPGISLTNGMITICTPNCHRFNLAGDPIASNISAVLYDEDSMAINNRKNGDLMVVSQMCEEGCEDGNYAPTIYLSRYAEKGERLWRMAIRDFSCDLEKENKVALRFHESGHEKCLMMACYRTIQSKDSWSYSEGNPHLDIKNVCFNEQMNGSPQYY